MTVHEKNNAQKEKYGTLKNKYDDFKVGDKVQIICICQDFNFFKEGITGKVIENHKEYLGIIVEFDDGETFGFEPSDLKVIDRESFHYNECISEIIKGLGNEWDNIDKDTQKEIKDKWRSILKKYFE